MGAADAVPGVSGGTIALISGIYEELISTISGVNLTLITTLRTEGFRAFWKQLNGNFLVALLIGILISFISFMRLAKYLIETHPILIWSFFFGLIIASVYFVGKQVEKWQFNSISAFIIGALFAFYISQLPPLADTNSSIFLFFAGALAICAMILPGISGAFILVILGAYKTLSDALTDFDFKRIAIFAVGAMVGLLSFSHVLKWLFKNYHNVTMAVLTGFIFGSLNKIWPWKLTETVMDKKAGKVTSFSEVSDFGNLSFYQKSIDDFESFITISEKSITPIQYSMSNNNIDSQVLFAVGLMLIGFLTIFILERLGNKKQ